MTDARIIGREGDVCPQGVEFERDGCPHGTERDERGWQPKEHSDWGSGKSGMAARRAQTFGDGNGRLEGHIDWGMETAAHMA
jgi:hypothetical protein